MCWPKPKDPTENKITLNDLHLINIQDDTACFYNYANPEAMEFEFKMKPVSSLGYPQYIQFEAEITQRMREFFEKIDVKIDKSDEAKIYIILNLGATVGLVPYFEFE